MEEYAAGKAKCSLAGAQISAHSRRPRSRVAIEERRVRDAVELLERYPVRAANVGPQPWICRGRNPPIALGIGINTGLFSILNSMALRPLPTPESTELVSIYQEFQGVKQRRVHGARSMFS